MPPPPRPATSHPHLRLIGVLLLCLPAEGPATEPFTGPWGWSSVGQPLALHEAAPSLVPVSDCSAHGPWQVPAAHLSPAPALPATSRGTRSLCLFLLQLWADAVILPDRFVESCISELSPQLTAF